MPKAVCSLVLQYDRVARVANIAVRVLVFVHDFSLADRRVCSQVAILTGEIAERVGYRAARLLVSQRLRGAHAKSWYPCCASSRGKYTNLRSWRWETAEGEWKPQPIRMTWQDVIMMRLLTTLLSRRVAG